MKFSYRTRGDIPLEAILDPGQWPNLIPAIVRSEARDGSNLIDVWMRWPIGLVRKVTVEVDANQARVDIVESEWMAGGVRLNEGSLLIYVDLFHGIPGSFAKELALQIQQAVLALGEDAVS